jgi:hypothetical protein
LPAFGPSLRSPLLLHIDHSFCCCYFPLFFSAPVPGTKAPEKKGTACGLLRHLPAPLRKATAVGGVIARAAMIAAAAASSRLYSLVLVFLLSPVSARSLAGTLLEKQQRKRRSTTPCLLATAVLVVGVSRPTPITHAARKKAIKLGRSVSSALSGRSALRSCSAVTSASVNRAWSTWLATTRSRRCGAVLVDRCGCLAPSVDSWAT